MSTGIMLGDTGDLDIKVMRGTDGLIASGLVIGENDGDSIALIIASNKGDIKEFPVLGVGEQYLKSVGRTAEIRADVQTQLELDGYKADVKMSETGKLIIDIE